MLHTHNAFLANSYIGRHRSLGRVAFVSLAILMGLSAFTIFPVSTESDATKAAPIPSETTLSLSTSNLSLVFDITDVNGTFAASDPATISVSTNNYTGYTLNFSSTSSDTNATKLVNGDNAIDSISAASTPEEFSVNNWGYLPSKFNSLDNVLYRPAPDTNGSVLDRTNTANLESNEYTVVLGAKADYSTPAGTYQNTFKFTAVANPVTYSVTYNKNTEDTVTNMPTNLAGDTAATSVTISDLVPQREGYDFLGWNTSADGSGATYNPNGDGTNLIYDLNQTTNNNGTLYAIWEKNKLYMQDVTLDTCPAERTLVYDSRDNQEYYIQKIGSTCWMTSNLNLAGGTKITPEKSNVADDFTLPASSTTDFVSWGSPAVHNDDTYGSYYNYIAATAGTNPSSGNATYDICPKGWRLPSQTEYNTLKATYTTGDALTAAPWYGIYDGQYAGSIQSAGYYGNYWASAAADSDYGYYLSFSKNNATITGGYKVNGLSVRCIAKTPNVTISFNANGGTGSMPDQTLEPGVGTINSNTFTRSGYTFTGWNTAANGSGTSYANGATYTGTSTTLYAQWQKLYIQNVTTATCPTTASIAYDNRDETAYTIQKLADGKCWMLDNLALDISNSTIKSKLSAANTNASATTLNYLKNGGGSTSNKYPVSGATNWTADSSFSVPLVNMSYKNTVPANSNYGPGSHKVGGYYNFCAASAGSYCYGDGEMDYGNPSGNATEDICPAGWRMPTGGSSGEYKNLVTTITGSTAYQIKDATQIAAVRNALSLSMSGDWYGNSPSNQGANGYIWASTMADEEAMNYFWMSQTYGLSPSVDSIRTGGYAVRCIAK